MYNRTLFLAFYMLFSKWKTVQLISDRRQRHFCIPLPGRWFIVSNIDRRTEDRRRRASSRIERATNCGTTWTTAGDGQRSPATEAGWTDGPWWLTPHRWLASGEWISSDGTKSTTYNRSTWSRSTWSTADNKSTVQREAATATTAEHLENFSK